MTPPNKFVAIIVAYLSMSSCYATSFPAEDGRLLKDGDRVVLLGGTFIERIQTHGYLETELSSVLRERNLTFRNLGWSGDNVLGESRAVFGSIEDGYARLSRDLKLATPSVVIIHYGIVEALSGPAGIERFRQGLQRLVDDIHRLDARAILLLPRPQGSMGDRFPSTATFNEMLGHYWSAILEVAKLTGSATVDLDVPGMTRLPAAPRGRGGGRSKDGRTPFPRGLTADELQLTAKGYWEQAPGMAAARGAARARPEFRIDLRSNRIDAAGMTVN